MKFPSTRRPISADFSGWNWMPHRQPEAAALTKARPWLVRATTARSSVGTAT
jgi:hypothetical protein